MKATVRRQRTTARRPHRRSPPAPAVARAAVPPELVRREPEPAAYLDEPVSPGILRARWRIAFAAAEAALRAGSGTLPPVELRAHAKLLACERASTAQLLEAYARDQRTSAPFAHLLLPPWQARRVLGLPVDVSACVFNLDGVLVGSASLHAAAWRETFDELIARRVERTRGRFLPFSTMVDYPAHLHGKPRLEGVRAFLASRGIRLPEGEPGDAPGAETVHGLANRKNEALDRLLERKRLSAYEGAREYLETARDAGLRCAVVSASAHTSTILAQAELDTLIDRSVDGNRIVAEHLRPRPEPDILVEACRLLGVEPRHTAVFETTPAGIAAACSAGFDFVIGIDHSGDAKALRAAGADAVAAGLEEFLDHRLAA